MTKILDEVLDSLMEAKNDVIVKNASEKDRNALISALREKTKADIIQEVKCECEKEIIKKANNEIQKRTNEERVKQLKSLMWNGFVVAFLVGLAINQVTELITVLKGLVPININATTSIISAILLVIVLVMYFYQFIKGTINILNELGEGSKKGEE